MKLPKYAEDIIQHVANCEERAIGTPAQDAFARMKKELVDESLTAKNPVPKRAEVNPWPKDNQLPADFKPNFKKWLDWRGENTFCLNAKAKFEDHPDIEEDICVMDGKMSFIYPFTCQGPRGCPDTDHDWIHLSVEKSVLDHANDEKMIVKDPYGGGELVISNWRAIMRELIEKGMKQEGYVAKSNPKWPKEELISFQYPKAVKLFKQGKKHKEVAAACPRLNEIHLDRAYEEATGKIIVRITRNPSIKTIRQLAVDAAEDMKRGNGYGAVEAANYVSRLLDYLPLKHHKEAKSILIQLRKMISPNQSRGYSTPSIQARKEILEGKSLKYIAKKYKMSEEQAYGLKLRTVRENNLLKLKKFFEGGGTVPEAKKKFGKTFQDRTYEWYFNGENALRKMRGNPRRSDGMKPSDFNQEQLYIGTRHEREHTDDMREAQRIAMDHLAEDPDYYKKLMKCVEGVEAEETWVDEQSNPTKPTVSELTKVFRETIKDPLTGMKIPGFNESQLGRALDKEEQDEVWRDIQLFIQKMVDQMLEKVMGLNLSREDGKPAALEFAQDPEQTKGESRERIETNRYYKLFFTSYLMSLLQRFFYVSPVGVKAVFDSLEGKKLYGEKNGWRRLAQFGNREANAMATYIGMLALMNKVSSKNLALWLDANPDHVKKIYEDADERWTKILAARGKVGEKELERINKERREAKKAVASLKAARPDDVRGTKLEVAKEKVRAPKEQKSLAEIKKKLANYEKKPPETAADFIIQDAEKKRH